MDPLVETLAGHLEAVATETLADRIHGGRPSPATTDGSTGQVELEAGPVELVLRRVGGDG